MFFKLRFIYVAVFAGAMLPQSSQSQEIACTSEMLDTCPGACVERCINDNSFYATHGVRCGEIGLKRLRNDPSLDVAQCARSSTPPTDSKLYSCLSQHQSGERPATGDDEIDAFFARAPGCAPTLVALEGMYGCLGDETADINTLYQPLLKQGYAEADVVTQREKLCAISDQQIKEDRLLTSVLAGQSTSLVNAFEDVRSCRQLLDQWLVSESNACEQNRTFLCENTIEGFIALLKKQIEPARKQESDTKRIIDDVDDQLASIRRAIASRAFVCEAVN